MDFINLPRKLIYKDRDNLKDFEVNNKKSINYYLFSKLKETPLMYMEGALDTALRCFNNAYYISTLIQLEDFPEIRVADYEQKLLEEKILFNEDICSTSMAMVCLLLPAYYAKWRQEDNDLIKAIKFRFTHYRWIHSECRKRFEDMAGSISPSAFILTQDKFAPRDIIEVIETFSEKDLQVYSEFICERLALIEDSRKRMYGADMAIARIKDYQRELCEGSDYNPKKDCFKYSGPEGMPIIRDLANEERVRECYKKSKEAIEYYMEHYPKESDSHSEQQTNSELSNSSNSTLVAENEQLRQQLAQYVSQVNELGKENAELNKENKELREQLASSSPISSDGIEELRSRAETLQSLYDAAENRLKRYETILGTEEDLSKENAFSITERIIFCSALLGCSLSEDDIIQQQMAKMIKRFSGDTWQSIRTTISKMNGKRTALEEVAKKVKQEKDIGARLAVWRREENTFKGLTNAALNVYKYLHTAVKGGTVGAKAHQCKQAMENIDHAYYLTERKLITPTDGQPQGDEFLLPPDEI